LRAPSADNSDAPVTTAGAGVGGVVLEGSLGGQLRMHLWAGWDGSCRFSKLVASRHRMEETLQEGTPNTETP